MAEPTTGPDWTGTLAVRVPDGDDGDLLACAERRVARVSGVRAVSVRGHSAIQPGLSATVVHLDVALTLAAETGLDPAPCVSVVSGQP